MKTPRQILIEARALIQRPENWTQGNFRIGNTCFCALGALMDVANDTPDSNYTGATKAIHEQIGGGSIIAFNDTHTHPEVLAAFDRAIESLT